MLDHDYLAWLFLKIGILGGISTSVIFMFLPSWAGANITPIIVVGVLTIAATFCVSLIWHMENKMKSLGESIAIEDQKRSWNNAVDHVLLWLIGFLCLYFFVFAMSTLATALYQNMIFRIIFSLIFGLAICSFFCCVSILCKAIQFKGEMLLKKAKREKKAGNITLKKHDSCALPKDATIKHP